MVLAWENLKEVFVLLFIFDIVIFIYLHLSMFFNLLLYLHLISRLLCHVTGTPPWFLRPVKASTSSELYPDYFWLPFLFHLPRELLFWVGIFYPQTFFYLTLLPNIFGTTCFYQGFPGSRQLFLGIFRVSYWSLKHRSGPSVCLIHSNP